MDTCITQEQFLILVSAMKAAYPSATFLPDEDAAKVWYQLLKDLDYKTLSSAIQRHMSTSPYPPTIADLRKMAIPEFDAPSDLAAWGLVRQAISNSAYHSQEEFDKLPPLIQKTIGNPANLREMALMDIDAVNSVEQSHFLRVYKTMVDREKELNKLSPALRGMIEGRQHEPVYLDGTVDKGA